ncbi:MAG: hypothetical protein Kow0063_18630 [Anaerolineae bacterium]
MNQQPVKLPDYSPDKFVDREEETNKVMEKVDALVQGLALDRRTIVFTGERGTGKSWLLAHLRDRMKERGGITAFLLNLDDYAAEDPLLAVMGVLKKFASDVLGRQPVTGVTLAEVSRALIPEVHRTLKTRPLAVLVDSAYESDWKMLAVLEDYFLGPLAVEPEVLVVMTGRGRPYPWKTPELRLKAEFEDLRPFEKPETTTQQLQRQKPEAVPKAEEIHQRSGGNPLANFLLASSYENLAQALDQVIKGLLETVPADQRDPVRRYLEALCVLRTFDEERIPAMLAAYYKDPTYRTQPFAQSRRVREAIVRWAFARWDETQGGYVIDEVIRTFVEHYLREDKTSRWQALHCAAYRLYERWAADYPQSRERWQQEVDYHAARLHEAGFSPKDCPSPKDQDQTSVELTTAAAVPA